MTDKSLGSGIFNTKGNRRRKLRSQGSGKGRFWDRPTPNTPSNSPDDPPRNGDYAFAPIPETAVGQEQHLTAEA